MRAAVVRVGAEGSACATRRERRAGRLWKGTSMTASGPNPETGALQGAHADERDTEAARADERDLEAAHAAERDLADVPAVEVVTTVALHLLSAAAVKLGLGEGPDAAEETDLAEARILITALAGLVTAAAPDLGSMHAGPLRDGLTAVQRAFREASVPPDPPGQGPGERLTGPVG